MFSQTYKYALGIIRYLASRQGERIPGGQIAHETGVPANYLSKILNQLRKNGIVDAEKGWGGGFVLRHDALNRPIHDILVIIDGAMSSTPDECFYGLGTCNLENPCPLHSYWERIREIHEEMLTTTSISDLST
jgi:Rrf2 family protein